MTDVQVVLSVLLKPAIATGYEYSIFRIVTGLYSEP
jgi:hypothetical protein